MMSKAGSHRGMRTVFYIAVLVLLLTLVNFSFHLNRRLTTSCFNADKVTEAIVKHARENLPSRSSSRIRRELPTAQNSVIPMSRKFSSNAPLREHFPKTVFYVWCGKRGFEFRHYLSVLSVIKFLAPNDIVFYYETYPVVDKWLYNTWFAELIDTYPFLQPLPLSQLQGACNGNDEPTKSYIYHILTASGGVFLDSDVIVTSSVNKLTAFDVVLAMRNPSGEKIDFMLAKSGYPCNAAILRNTTSADDFTEFKIELIKCPFTNIKYETDILRSPCGIMDETIFPKSIWQLDTSFGRLARTMFYGYPEIRHHVPNMASAPVPKIGHMVWLGGKEMTFLFYLGVLSLLNVARMNTVYIHADLPPSGFYWNLLVTKEPRVIYYHRVRPRTIYGQPITSLWHISDIWRADILCKVGGVYLDTDAVFVNELPEDLFNYDAVASYDWPEWNKPFPDTINLGVTMGKRGAPYWKLFQESMRWFRDNDFGWNGIRRPYQVFERHPDLMKMDARLQVICYRLLCHPTWWPDYHKDEVHHMVLGRTFNWRNETFAMHWTDPTPYELRNHRNLIRTDSMFADIGKLIISQSGMLEYFEKIVADDS